MTEYVSGDFTAHWQFRILQRANTDFQILNNTDAEQMRRGLAALPRRPPPRVSAEDVWTLGKPFAYAQ
jgi:hypothetical protein